jgi:hypothetical protein
MEKPLFLPALAAWRRRPRRPAGGGNRSARVYPFGPPLAAEIFVVVFLMRDMKTIRRGGAGQRLA